MEKDYSKLVCYDKVFTTSYGLDFGLKPSEYLDELESYDYDIAMVHLKNVGCIVVDPEYGDVIDNEYDLEDIYTMIEEGKCV